MATSPKAGKRGGVVIKEQSRRAEEGDPGPQVKKVVVNESDTSDFLKSAAPKRTKAKTRLGTAKDLNAQSSKDQQPFIFQRSRGKARKLKAQPV